VRAASRDLVVGFDLDMTLIDSRRSIRTALVGLVDETGADIDVDHVLATLGPPLEDALSPWFGPDALGDACARFRELHGAVLDQTDLMAGASQALAAVAGRGGTTVVVTSKYEPHARASLEAVGLAVDHVVGWRFGPAKGVTLRSFGAQVYVGDHPADMEAAAAGGTVAVAVATGGASAAELAGAGAHVVLDSLTDFARWFGSWAGAHPS